MSRLGAKFFDPFDYSRDQSLHSSRFQTCCVSGLQIQRELLIPSWNLTKKISTHIDLRAIRIKKTMCNANLIMMMVIIIIIIHAST